jgi:2-polyprenyl-3-methyl-5-hydroxy-6-metoxy-1,4-benzoquinol methylase
MMRRIPHEDEAITGSEETERYLKNHGENLNLQYGAFLRELRRAKSRKRLLEVGCGPGFLVGMVAKEHPRAEIVALDLSPDMIAIAKRHLKKQGVHDRVTLVEGRAEDMAKLGELGAFDLVYSTFSLHHWNDPVAALRSLWSKVDQSGVLLLHDLRRVFWLYYCPSQSGFIRSVRGAYVPEEVRSMLKEAGISDYSLKIPFPYFWMTVVALK